MGLTVLTRPMECVGIAQCGKRSNRRSLCRMHYARLVRHGDPLYTSVMSPIDRLLQNAKRLPNGCLIFGGSHRSGVYGALVVDGKNTKAHRLSYQLQVGPIPDGMFVLHKCDTPLCIEPDHLFPGTPKDNTRDMMAKGRQKFFIGKVILRGERAPSAKLSDADVDAIRVAVFDGESQHSVARRYGVSQGHVSALIRKKKRSTVHCGPST